MPLLHVINFYLLSVLIYFLPRLLGAKNNLLGNLLGKLAGGTKFYRKLPPKVWRYVANKD